jgi:Flp pilus assembly protein TadG
LTAAIVMLDAMRDRIASFVCRLMPAGMRRFLRREDGAAAVEFGMVALPFFGLMFAILETSLVFFAGQSLEAAVAEASRQIMTGQAQQANYSQSDFKTNAVCTYLAAGVSMFDCANGVYVSVQTYTTFADAQTNPPVTNGELNTNLPYTPGGPGNIVVVQLYYKWPIYVSLLGDNLSNFGTTRLLVATSVFRNEPYQ